MSNKPIDSKSVNEKQDENKNLKQAEIGGEEGNLLIVNCGSSSIKVSLFSSKKKQLKNLIDAQINEMQSQSPWFSTSNEHVHRFNNNLSIREAIQYILDYFEKNGWGAESIKAVGHRFVHGGDNYFSPTLIDQNVLNHLEELNLLAPLHNPSSLKGIQACISLLGWSIKQVTFFDTAFFHDLPLNAKLYAIPIELSKKYPIRRYGFHGIAHQEVFSCYQQAFPNQNSKIITVHLGNGCSMAAINAGKCLDTSMGFTPTEGLIMGTRCGDIDPTVMSFLCEKEKKSPADISKIYNQESGLLGVSGLTSNMQELIKNYESNEGARLAVDMFSYRISKYIGAYLSVLEGADGIVFSGGIGENSPQIRQKVIQSLHWLDVKISPEANIQTVIDKNQIKRISTESSKIGVFICAVNENAAMAKQLVEFLTNQ